MAKKHSGLSKAAILAAGVGAAAFAAKKHTDHLAEEGQTLSGEIKEAVAKTAEKTIKMPAPDPSYRNTCLLYTSEATAIQSAANMRKTARAFTTPTVTTKHSPVPKNRKALTTKMHIWWVADWLLSQQHASL